MAKTLPISPRRDRFDYPSGPDGVPGKWIVRDRFGLVLGSGSNNPIALARPSKACCCDSETGCNGCCTNSFLRNRDCCYSFGHDTLNDIKTGFDVVNFHWFDQVFFPDKVSPRSLEYTQNGNTLAQGFGDDCDISAFFIPCAGVFISEDGIRTDFERDVNLLNPSPRDHCPLNPDYWFNTIDESGFVIAQDCKPTDTSQPDISRETHGLNCKTCCLSWDEAFSAQDTDSQGKLYTRNLSFSYTIENTARPCNSPCTGCT